MRFLEISSAIWNDVRGYIDGLVQERRNSNVLPIDIESLKSKKHNDLPLTSKQCYIKQCSIYMYTICMSWYISVKIDLTSINV